MNKIVNRLFLALVVFTFPLNIYCQNSSSAPKSDDDFYKLVEQKYGLNQVLINGKYFENVYVNDLGHPYFSEDEYKNGSLVVHKQKFDKLLLKYNIYDQTLVIVHTDQLNSKITFIPPSDFVLEFSIGNHKFRKYGFANQESRFYEEIYLGKIICLCIWEKDRDKSEHNKSFMAYKFSDSKKEFFLVIENIPYPLKNKNALVKLFPAHKKSILQFMKEHGIKLYKSPDDKIVELITYCEELSSATTDTASSE